MAAAAASFHMDIFIMFTRFRDENFPYLNLNAVVVALIIFVFLVFYFR